MKEVWIGLVELGQLPVVDPGIRLDAAGAFTWVACWASNSEEFAKLIEPVFESYGLFVHECDEVMPFQEYEGVHMVGDELWDQVERVQTNERFVIYGTFHGYKKDQ